MNAKSIYDNLVDVQGIPSSILTYSDKEDCIIIEIQDYNKSVFKFAKEFFKGYKSTDIIYTNEDKTAVWYNEVSVYSDRETIQAITDFYYRAKAKGLVESKKSARKSIEESLDVDQFTNLFLDVLGLIFIFSQRKNIRKALGYKENESIIKTLIMNVKKALEEMNDDSRIN